MFGTYEYERKLIFYILPTYTKSFIVNQDYCLRAFYTSNNFLNDSIDKHEDKNIILYSYKTYKLDYYNLRTIITIVIMSINHRNINYLSFFVVEKGGKKK